MRECSICRAEGEKMSVSVSGFHLCGECFGKLLHADPARAEYDWYAAHVRRGLAEGPLRRGNVVEIERYRALRREAK